MAELLQIGGSTINRVTANITLTRCTPFLKDGVPSFQFVVRGGLLAALPDPYLEKSFE